MKEIVLSQKRQIKYFKSYMALVDDEDYNRISKHCWHYSQGYASTRIYNKDGSSHLIKMHRMILNITDPKIKIDHENHNGLDNQKNNLRICNQSDNNKNKTAWGKSKFLGVSYQKERTKPKRAKAAYIAEIKTSSNKLYLGRFPAIACGEILAAVTYDIAAEKYHKNFANFNFKVLW